MRIIARLAVWMVVIALLALGLTGCFRSAGDDLEPTPKAGVVPEVVGTPADAAPQATTESQPTSDVVSPTAEELTPLASPVVSPSLTPFPTFSAESTRTPTQSADGQGGPLATPVPPTVAVVNTNTPQPTVAPQITAAIQATNTPRPTNTPLPTSTPLATSTTLPTSTPRPSSTPTKLPVIGPTLTFTPVPFLTFPPSPTYTPYSQGAMIVPVEAQPLAERPPQEVNSESFGTGGPDQGVAVAAVATPTPTPSGDGVALGGGTPPDAAVAEVALQSTPLSPGQMTATMIVFEATATIAALTGTPLATLPPVDGQGGQFVTQAPVQVIPAGQFPPNATVITATPFGQGGICAEHTISLGETLYTIARRYGVSAEQIQAVNTGLIPTIDQISAGDKIAIPCAITPTPTAQPVPIVTGVSDGQGGALGSTTVATGNKVHVVVPGDTLFSIARQYGVDIFDLMAANGFTQSTMNFIYEGDEIIVPNQVVTQQVVVTPVPGIAPTLTPYIVIVTPAGQ